MDSDVHFDLQVKRTDLLSDPDALHLAQELKAHGVKVVLGNRPVLVDLGQLYTSQSAPPELAKRHTRYRICLIGYHVGVVALPESMTVEYLSFEVAYRDTPAALISVLEVLPQTAFVRNLGGRLECVANLSANGRAQVAEDGVAAQVAKVLKLPIAGEAKLEVGVNGDFCARLSFSVLSPTVQAIGVGSTRSEWQIQRQRDNSLIGDHPFYQVLLIPTRAMDRPLQGTVRFGAVLEGWWRTRVEMTAEPQTVTFQPQRLQ